MIVLTTFDLDEYVYDALGAGASGFLLKDVTADTLFDAVRVVAAGDALLAPTVTRRLVERVRTTAAERAEPSRARSPSSRRARSRCCASWPRASRTVRSPSGSSSATRPSRRTSAAILAKLDVRDRTQAVVVAYESGLVTPRAREPV